MLSIYDTMVEDRKVSHNFLIKKILYFLDRFSCLLADKVVLDTPEHADYFSKEFIIPRNKLAHVYIGADESIFFPLVKEDSTKFKVLFYGKFSPLHGIDTIVRAAKILSQYPEIELEIIGTGQVHKDVLNLSKDLDIHNIKFVDWVDFEKLPHKIARADVCLGGHFGASLKGQRVVANKVFQMIAMAKPVIIADCPSSKNAGFIDRVNCLLCPVEDPEYLAKTILLIKNDNQLSERIAKEAADLFNQNFTTEKIGQAFKNILEYKSKTTWIPTAAYMIRKKIIMEHIKNDKQHIKNFLEIGFGSGDMISSLSPYFDQGEGIDTSDEAVMAISPNVNSPKIKFRNSDFLQRTEQGKYQMILALEVLEHIKDDFRAFRQINNLLDKNGKFIMSVPAHQSKWSILDEWAGHYRRYEKKELIDLINRSGFEIIKFYNYGFPLLNMLWFIRKKIIKKNQIKSSKSDNTSRSGLDRSVESRFKFFFNDFFVLPFYILQKLFMNFDFSPAYLIILKKVK